MNINVINLVRTTLLDLPLIYPVTIEGPISVSEYIQKGLNPKRIYLFGDEHIKAKVCPDPNVDTITLENFLVSTFEDNPDKVIDVFLESEFTSKNISRTHVIDPGYTYLEGTLQYFSSCLEIDKSKCEYKNVRFHYADIRGTTALLKQLNLLHKYIITYNNKWMLDIDPSDPYNKQLLMTYISSNIPIIYNELFNTTIQQLFLDTKIQKQFDAIVDIEIKNYLEKFFIQLLGVQKALLLNKLKHMMNHDIHDIIINNNYGEIWKFPLFLQDAYMAGRIFRSFENGLDPKNIIIYVGDLHKRNLEIIFKRIGMTYVGGNTSDVHNVDFQCLRIGLKLPFFQ